MLLSVFLSNFGVRWIQTCSRLYRDEDEHDAVVIGLDEDEREYEWLRRRIE